MDLRIIVADDHPFVLLGVRAMLTMRAGVTIVGEAATPTALVALLQHAPCDVLVTDLSMPEPSGVTQDGLSLIRRIRRDWPQLRIVVMTTLTGSSMLREIVADGVVSALNKTESMNDLWRAIEASAKGVTYRGRSVIESLGAVPCGEERTALVPLLSQRQAEVVQRFVGGQSVAEIAAALGCHRRMVSRQKREAMIRLGVATNSDLFYCASARFSI